MSQSISRVISQVRVQDCVSTLKIKVIEAFKCFVDWRRSSSGCEQDSDGLPHTRLSEQPAEILARPRLNFIQFLRKRRVMKARWCPTIHQCRACLELGGRVGYPP